MYSTAHNKRVKATCEPFYESCANTHKCMQVCVLGTHENAHKCGTRVHKQLSGMAQTWTHKEGMYM